MTVIPSDAATVMLLRPCPDKKVKDIEVLLVLRNRKSSFVPGYYVFPGGAVDHQDFETGVENFVRGIGRREAAQILADMSHPDKALGAWVAGIRETFEEAGMLIACKKDGTPVSMQTEDERRRYLRYRKALNGGEMKFSQILAAEDIVLPLNQLYYFSHWITPEPFPLRYDVRFFVAQAPADQTVMHDGFELTGHCWLRPSEALKRYEQGQLDMVLPQIMTLQDIARFKTIVEAVDSAKKRHVPATLTQIRRIDGRDVEVMPDGTVFENRPPVYSWPDQDD